MNEISPPPRGRAAVVVASVALVVVGSALALVWMVFVDGMRSRGTTLGTASVVATIPVFFAATLAVVVARLVRSGVWRTRAIVFACTVVMAAVSIGYLTAVVVDTSGARLARTTHELLGATTGELPLLSGILDKVASEGGVPTRPRTVDEEHDGAHSDGGAADLSSTDPHATDGGQAFDAGQATTTRPRDAGSSTHEADAERALPIDAGAPDKRANGRPIAFAAVSLVLDTGSSAVARVTLHDDDTATAAVISLAALAARGPLTRATAFERGAIVVVIGKERVARVPLAGELDVMRALARGARLADGSVIDAVQDAIPLTDDIVVAVVDAGAPLVTRLVLQTPAGELRVLHEVKKSERRLVLKAAHGDTFVVEDRPILADPKAPAVLLLGHASGSGALQVRARLGDAMAPIGKVMGAFGSVMIRRDAALVVDAAFADALTDGWPVLLEDGVGPRIWLSERYPDRALFAVRGERLQSPVIEPSGGFFASTGGALVEGDLFAPEKMRRTRDPFVDAKTGPMALARVTPLQLAPTRRSALVVAETGEPPVRGVFVVDLETGAARAVLREGDDAQPGVRIRALAVAPAAGAPSK